MHTINNACIIKLDVTILNFNRQSALAFIIHKERKEPLMLDLKKLRYLDAIYKYGSFTQASKELFVSQPAISAAITSLEKQLGVELLIRNSKSVTFTPAGERFMIYTQHILQECEKAEQDMKYMSKTYDQTLRMGLSPFLSHHLLPYLYDTFISTRKNAQLQIFEFLSGRETDSPFSILSSISGYAASS